MELNSIREYIDTLNKYTDAYEKGSPLVSDQEWDSLYFKLQELEKETGLIYPDSPTQHIEYNISNELNKVTHNHLMLSAAKTKDWDSFLNYFNKIDSTKDVIEMLKLDGLTLSLRYLNGKLVSAETRGNGEVGEDVTHNARVISSIPQEISYKNELILDGEIICRYDNFKPFENDYKNPRNFASGSIRLLDSKECAARNLTFVVWYIAKGLDSNSLLYKFKECESLGFTVVPYTSSLALDAKEYLENRAKECQYPIDGLIGRFDDLAFGESLGTTSHHRNDLFAFKYYDEEYETNLIDLDYNVSRNGEMVPVAIFEPIEIDGSIVSRCSLHNLSIMEELNGGFMRKGDILWITKRNQIIPNCERWQATAAETDRIKLPKVCPYCGKPTSIHVSETGVKKLFCDNTKCGSRLTNKIDHYASKKGIEIKGLSDKTIEKLIDLNWIQNIKDLYTLKNHRSEWIKLAGFGAASVDKILNAIEDSKNTELYKFISALGIPLVGVTVAKEINKYYNTWDDFRVATNSKWSDLDGFGLEIEKAIQNFDYSEADKIAAMLTFKQPAVQNEEPSSTSAAGLIFVVTGKVNVWKNRSALQSYIESLGGKVASSVSSKTNYLINNDSESSSAKNLKAKSLGIPIITESEFIASFGQNCEIALSPA